MGKRHTTLFFISALGFLAVTDAYKDFLCSTDPAKAFFSCSEDCQHQHGAVDGKCGDVGNGDYNCYCGARAPEVYENSLHCQKRTDDFRAICTVDCLCNHAAEGGYCDWDMKACICVGENVKNVNCPAETVPDFGKFVYDHIGETDLGDRGMMFIHLTFKFTPVTDAADSQLQPLQRAPAAPGRRGVLTYARN